MEMEMRSNCNQPFAFLTSESMRGRGQVTVCQLVAASPAID